MMFIQDYFEDLSNGNVFTPSKYHSHHMVFPQTAHYNLICQIYERK